MREIKFRAWSPYWETMFYTDGNYSSVSGCEFEEEDFFFRIDHNGLSLGITEIVDELINGEHEQNFRSIDRDDTVFLQFTGLHDKNGREIYEGDILRVWVSDEYVPNRDSGGGIIDYDCEQGFSQLGVVGFSGCSFDYRTVKTESGRQEGIHAPIDWIGNYEVIGNQFENPELLEQTS